MNVRMLRCAVLENASGVTLMTDFNKLCQGEVVSASGSFAAGFITTQQVVSVQMDGDRIIVFYTE